VNASSIIDSERDVLDAVTVLGMVRRELLVVDVEGRTEREADVVVFDDVRAVIALASLQTLSKSKSEIRFWVKNSG